MDREASLGTARDLFEGRHPSDVAGGRSEFLPQQHHGGGAVCGYREDVVEETRYLSLEATHPAELCLWYGWRVYVDRYAAKPDYLWSLC